jgi:hypothetical protein
VHCFFFLKKIIITVPRYIFSSFKILIARLGIGVIIFGSVFIKKNNQTEIFFKNKNRSRTETGSNRPVSVRFFRTKPVQTGLVWFSRFGSVFFLVFSVRVRFDFFDFRLIKPKPNRSGLSKF